MTLDSLLARLDHVKPRGNGRYASRCPAHVDRSPSLSISEGDKGLLLRCFAGCTVAEICEGLGIDQRDLFFDAHDATSHGTTQRPITPPTARIDRRARAFQFEIGALDLRLRAEKIIEAGKALDMEHLSDDERDRAMNTVVKAYDDMARAELFEQVADTLRMKEFIERDHEQLRRTA